MLWVYILPPREGYFSLILCPLPRGLEWFLFVTKNNSPRCPRGSTHGEANDKCIKARQNGEREREMRRGGGLFDGGDYFKYLRQRGTIIRGTATTVSVAWYCHRLACHYVSIQSAKN